LDSFEIRGGNGRNSRVTGAAVAVARRTARVARRLVDFILKVGLV